MSLDKDTVARIARLARLKVPDEELAPLASEAGRQPAGDGVFSDPVASFGMRRTGAHVNGDAKQRISLANPRRSPRDR